MAHWRVIILICIALFFVEAKRSHRKREAKSHLCDPGFNNTNKIQCYCTENSREIITSAECMNDDIGLEDPNWNAFIDIKHVTKLTFSSTGSTLKYVPQNAFIHTPELMKLEIKYGNIEVIHPFAFANMSSIREIILSGNQIRILKPNAFAHHANITTIGLDMNVIVEINRDVFIDLPILEKLYLTSNKITTIHDRAFVHLINLRELEIDRNNLFSLNSETFSGLSKLEKLDLSGNAIQVIGDNTFLPLANLQILNLDENKIQMLDNKAFNGLSKLHSLSLARNVLSDIDNEKVFEGLKSLTLLSLKGNQLAILKPEVMAPILENFYSNVSSFDVEDNNFPCNCQLDWFILLISKTQSPHLKLATENLKCTPDDEIKEKWNKATELEKNMQENVTNDYDYYDDTQLNGKLFYIDMRYLLNCSDIYNGETINIANIINVPTTLKPTTKVSNPTIKKLQKEDKVKPNINDIRAIKTSQDKNEKDSNVYTTTRLATVSDKPIHDKIFDELNMASDEGKPEIIKAHSSIQDNPKDKQKLDSTNNAYNKNSNGFIFIAIQSYLGYLITKY